MRKIPLTLGKYALVDAADFEFLNSWKWYYGPCSKTGYAKRNTKTSEGKPRKTVRMHEVIFGKHADHVNGNGLDNRRKNLRKASPQQQAYNKSVCKNKKTLGCKGVSITRDKKGIPKYWIARITVRGKRHYLGTFPNHKAASNAYIKKAKELHGEFARWK